MVYEDAEKLYAEVQHSCHLLLEDAFDVLFPNSFPVTMDTPTKLLGRAGQLIACNPTFFPRWEVIEIPYAGVSPSLRGLVTYSSVAIWRCLC